MSTLPYATPFYSDCHDPVWLYGIGIWATWHGLILHAFCCSLLIFCGFLSKSISHNADVNLLSLCQQEGKKKKNLKNICSPHGKLGKLLIQLDQTDFTIKMTYYLSGHFILSFWEGHYVTKDTTGPWVRNWLLATRENLRPLKSFLFLSCGAVIPLPSSNGIFWISCYNVRLFWNSTRTSALL